MESADEGAVKHNMAVIAFVKVQDETTQAGMASCGLVQDTSSTSKHHMHNQPLHHMLNQPLELDESRDILSFCTPAVVDEVKFHVHLNTCHKTDDLPPTLSALYSADVCLEQ